jgi:hypothetical protein
MGRQDELGPGKGCQEVFDDGQLPSRVEMKIHFVDQDDGPRRLPRIFPMGDEQLRQIGDQEEHGAQAPCEPDHFESLRSPAHRLIRDQLSVAGSMRRFDVPGIIPETALRTLSS